MIWTVIAISNVDNKPSAWTFDGPEEYLAAYDMARVENKDQFVVCLIGGECFPEFAYESVALVQRKEDGSYPSEINGFLLPKFHTRSISD